MLDHMERADPATHPCELTQHPHRPMPAQTAGHHIFPKYLQAAVWGAAMLVSPKVTDLVWLCPTDHVNVHVGLEALLSSKPTPSHVTERQWALAVEALTRYKAAGGTLPVPSTPPAPPPTSAQEG